MDNRNETVTAPEVTSAEHLAPSEIALALGSAQQRALEQRLAVEELLAEARALEERLAAEVLAARAAAERALAREHAAAAVAAAQLEREAIAGVDACAATLAELAQQRADVGSVADNARSAHEAASNEVATCEQLLTAARAELQRAAKVRDEAEAHYTQLLEAQSSAEAESAAVTQRLAEHREARQQAETASSEAEERARALGARDEADGPPSLEPVEELRLLEARIALRAEAAKRAAERRASDLARNHVIH